MSSKKKKKMKKTKAAKHTTPVVFDYGVSEITMLKSAHPRINKLLAVCGAGDTVAIEAALPECDSIAEFEVDIVSSKQTLLWMGLRNTVMSGCRAAVGQLLGADADPNLQTECGVTPLMAAAARGYTCIVQLLLDHNAYPGPTDRPVDRSVGRRLPCPSSVNSPHTCTALHYGCFEGHLTAVEALVRAGSDIRALSPAGDTGLDICERKRAALNSGKEAEQKRYSAIAELLRAADAKERACLVMMSHRGDCEGMKALLDAGSDIEAIGDYISPGDNKTRLTSTALTAAAHHGEEAAVTLLLERKADVEACGGMDRSMTALMAAAGIGFTSIVQLLLDHGADTERVSNETDSAFHFACCGYHLDAAEVLVRGGCDTARRDFDGLTGRDFAKQRGFTDVVKRLDALDAEFLVKAAAEGDCAAVTLLLDRGADVNAVSPVPSLTGNRKSLSNVILSAEIKVYATPLIAAIFLGFLLHPEYDLAYYAVIELLLERGADPDKLSSGGGYEGRFSVSGGGSAGSALELATGKGLDSIIKLLLQHGANIDKTEAINSACEVGQAGVVEILVRAGCDTGRLHVVDPHTCMSSYDIAKKHGHTTVLAILDALEAEAAVKAEAKAAKKRAQNKKKQQRRKEVKRQQRAQQKATLFVVLEGGE